MTEDPEPIARTPDEPGQQVARTPRGNRTRLALLRAARQVFEEKGFLEARIIDITEKIPVAQGTFYIYFASKEQIFQELVEIVIRNVSEALKRREGYEPDPVERIRRANRTFIAAYRENAAFLRVLEQVATFNNELREVRRKVRSSFVERIERGIRRLQEARVADRTIDPRIAAAALTAMVDNFAYVWLGLGEPYNEEAAVETLTQLWANALGIRAD